MIRSSLAPLSLVLLLDPGWSEVKQFTPTMVMAFLLIWAVLKFKPDWKAVKLREMDIREAEITQLATFAVASNKLADVVREIAIEQKFAAEALRIGERVNQRAGDALKGEVEDIAVRLDQIELKVKSNGQS